MDKYVKRIKRKEDGSVDDTNKFYVPGCQYMAADDDDDDDELACVLSVQQPAAPQKTEQSDSPPSPISSVSPVSADSSKKSMGQMKRNYVSRRLLFDDKEKISLKEPANEQMVIKSQLIKGLEKKTAPEVNPYQTVIDSLSARGFIVNNNSHCKDDDSSLGQYGQCLSAVSHPQTTSTEREDSGILTSPPPPIFKQFICLSIFEGISYSVRVADAGPAANESIETAKMLAAIGPHPYIVSYFCNWSDARYHYIQTEQCQASLSSLRLNNVADCRTVLEHVSCALHYLHDGKMYAHNRVGRPNVFTAMDGDRVVYKLGGFDAATKLTTDSSGAAAAADIQYLCLMVSELIKDSDVQWSADEDDDLRQYLSSVTQTACPASANALSIWRWCCGVRPPLQRTRQSSMSAMMYGTVGAGDESGAVAAGQATAVARSLSFRKTAARRAYGVAAAAASTSK